MFKKGTLDKKIAYSNYNPGGTLVSLLSSVSDNFAGVYLHRTHDGVSPPPPPPKWFRFTHKKVAEINESTEVPNARLCSVP